jgi:hypothetical protein
MNQNFTTRSRKLERWGLTTVLGLFILLALLYDFLVPVFEKPDELKHFAVVQYIQTHVNLPVVVDGVYKPWDQEGTQPPLYHMLAAVATAWLNLEQFEEPPRNPHYADDRSFVWRERGNNNLYLHPPGENWQPDTVIIAARVARWVSILAGIGTLLLSYSLARIIWADKIEFGESAESRFTIYRWLPLLAVSLAAFVPQFLHVSAAITNDSLSVTLAAASWLLLALILKNGCSTRYAGLLGFTLGLGAITKLSLLYLYPLAAVVLLIDFYRVRLLGKLVKYGFILGGISVVVAGWWFWRNWQLYADVSALSAHLLYRGGALDPTPTLAQIWQTEITGLELTFWAAFGAGQILIAPWIYNALSWLKYLILAGIVVGGWQTVAQWQSRTKATSAESATGGFTKPDLATEFITLTLLALWVVIIFGALLRWMQITPASWGRLLFPALPALAVLSAWGLVQFPLLAQRITVARWPGSFARMTLSAIPWLVALSLFTLAGISPLYIIRSAYAKTPLVSEADLPSDINHLDITFADGSLRLIGYQIDQSSAQPGDWLPVTVFWQAVRPIEKNYSAFVHILDPDGKSLAQANSYPDAGRWPTSMLEPGSVLADRTFVFIPPDLPTPVAARLALGIFEFDDPARAAKPAANAAGEAVESIVPGVPIVPHEWPAFDPAVPLDANFAGQIQLTGYDWIDEPVSPGQSIPLTLYWKALASLQKDLNLFIHLIDPVTQTQVAGFDGPPHFPTGYWQAGTTVADQRTLQIPDSLPLGQYDLVIGWYNLDDFARLPLHQAEPADALPLISLTVE